MQNTAMQKIDPNRPATLEVLKHVLEQKRTSLSRLLPPSVDPDRFIESLMQIHAESQGKIDRCTIATVWGCALGAAKLGLDIGKTLRQACIVPFYDKKSNTTIATLIIEYSGYEHLLRQNGYSQIFCEVIFDGDDWEIALGTERHLRHIPKYATDIPVGAYMTALDPHGQMVFHFMHIKKIMEIKAKVIARRGNDTAWVTDEHEMIRKTPLLSYARKFGDIAPKQKEIVDAVESRLCLSADPSPMPAGSDDVEILEAEATPAEQPAPRFPGNPPAQTQAAEPALAPPRRGRPPKTEKEEPPTQTTQPVTTTAEAPPEESDKHLDTIAATLDRTGFPESEFLAAVARLCEMSTVPRNLAGIPRTARGFIASQAADIIRARQEGGAK